MTKRTFKALQNFSKNQQQRSFHFPAGDWQSDILATRSEIISSNVSRYNFQESI